MLGSMSTIQLDCIKLLKHEDEKAFSDCFTWMQRACMEVEADLTPGCTMSDNCDAIINSPQKFFPRIRLEIASSIFKKCKIEAVHMGHSDFICRLAFW